MVDHVIIMNAGNEIGWTIVLSLAGDPLVCLFRIVPAAPTTLCLLCGQDLPKKLDMTRGEKIKPSVDIDNTLTRLGRLTIDEWLVAKRPGFVDKMVDFCLVGTAPYPDLRTGLQATLVTGIVCDSLHQVRRGRFPLVCIPGAFLAREGVLHRFDKVVPSTEEHPTNEIGGGDARGPSDDAETPSRLDESITVVSAAVRGDIIAVDNIVASIVRHPRE